MSDLAIGLRRRLTITQSGHFCAGEGPRPLPTSGDAPANALVLQSNKSNPRPHLDFFFRLGLAFVGGGAAASRASRSAFRRSRLFENAVWAISCSLIAVLAPTSRNAFRASRSALLICLGGSFPSGVFIIFL